MLADTDGDGLEDGAEVNTHTTNPLLADTDADDAGDWYEIFATFTDPKVAASKPNIPYPLPKPDNTPPATDKPVKVFILMGQSNMQGKGAINPIDTPGTLATVVKEQNKFPNLIDTNGNWSARGDVKYRGVISCIGNADLTVGQGTGATQIGPELGFGHVMGYHFDEPVIVIKASFGGQDLGFDFLAPGSQRYTMQWQDLCRLSGHRPVMDRRCHAAAATRPRHPDWLSRQSRGRRAKLCRKNVRRLRVTGERHPGQFRDAISGIRRAGLSDRRHRLVPGMER